jgi:hypothetical protein
MNQIMNRKEFLSRAGLCGLGSCACVLGLSNLFAEETKPAAPAPSAQPAAPEEKKEERPKPKRPRAEERIEFAEKWVRRFMDVLDGTLDEATCKKVMMASGRACFLAYIQETGRAVRKMSLEQYAAWVKDNIKDGSFRVEGNVIFMQYNAAAETGLPSPDGACLCPLVETKPAGLSATYCHCSVGYVKVWHELKLDRPVEVELLDSVLRGGARCRFKITVT